MLRLVVCAISNEADDWVCTFDANVAVQSGCNDGANHGENVASSLKTILGDAEIAGVDDILALVAVHEQTVEHVDDVDEQLGEPHSLFRGFSQNALQSIVDCLP
jgi:hypothetical protein